jgi:hypothetical protein
MGYEELTRVMFRRSSAGKLQILPPTQIPWKAATITLLERPGCMVKRETLSVPASGHILTIYYAARYTIGANETRSHQYVFSPQSTEDLDAGVNPQQIKCSRCTCRNDWHDNQNNFPVICSIGHVSFVPSSAIHPGWYIRSVDVNTVGDGS